MTGEDGHGPRMEVVVYPEAPSTAWRNGPAHTIVATLTPAVGPAVPTIMLLPLMVKMTGTGTWMWER